MEWNTKLSGSFISVGSSLEDVHSARFVFITVSSLARTGIARDPAAMANCNGESGPSPKEKQY